MLGDCSGVTLLLGLLAFVVVGAFGTVAVNAIVGLAWGLAGDEAVAPSPPTGSG